MSTRDGFEIGWRIALLLAIVPAVHLSMRLFVRGSGWAALAAAFPWDGGTPPNLQTRASLEVGLLRMHNVVTLGWDESKLYVRAPWLIHLGTMDPLAVPFSAMRHRSRIRRFWRERDRIVVDAPGRRVTMIFSAKNTAAFEAKLPPIAHATVLAP